MPEKKAERVSTSSKQWVLTTTLPARYRAPAAGILRPPLAPTSAAESMYVALYTVAVALVTLAGGSVSEERLDRYLRRLGAEVHTPLDRTERVLARMLREGYLVRNRSVDGGEEVVEYVVGPRGKVEVGVRGVAALAGTVYGFGADVLEDKADMAIRR
ncbi:hypothetical protein KEM52_003225 [Ascosphaera acerosa]|nr:hypothetical protein KEM52_003225 [Ascosphaera acerosa]